MVFACLLTIAILVKTLISLTENYFLMPPGRESAKYLPERQLLLFKKGFGSHNFFIFNEHRQ
jgi:hypothetical protein